MSARPRRKGLLAGAALLAGLGVWLGTRARAPEAARPAPPSTEDVVEPRPAAPLAVAVPEVAREADEAEHAQDGLPFMPAAADAPRPDGPAHPHPLTPAHQRIFRENRLVGALNGAMDVEDVPSMRSLLREYRDEFPEDDNQLQQGYAVIADCFERPGAPARAAASRWADAHRGSTLRRFVSRHCQERSEGN